MEDIRIAHSDFNSRVDLIEEKLDFDQLTEDDIVD
jgi:hypothetical protein